LGGRVRTLLVLDDEQLLRARDQHVHNRDVVLSGFEVQGVGCVV